jgi:hypothetical protein
MTEIYKGSSGQNRYILMTERDARQLLAAKPYLKFYRCEQVGEFDAVLAGLPTTPKIELCNKLNMDASNHEAFLLDQFKAGNLHLYYTGASHYTFPDKKLAENAESAFYLAPAIYGIEFSGVKYSNLTSTPGAANQYIQRFNLDDTKIQQLVERFYVNTGSMYKNGAPQLSPASPYKDHLLKLLADGDAIIIEKPKSLFKPQEEIISTAVGVSALRPSQVNEPVEEEPLEEDPVEEEPLEEDPVEEDPEKSDFYFSI